MIELVLKSCNSDDIPSLNAWEPSNLEEVYILLDLAIGVKGEKGADYFQLIVATPEALRQKEFDAQVPVFIEHTLLVNHYNWEMIYIAIKKKIKNCQAKNWEKSVEKLSRYFCWEYEDHSFVS